MPLWGRDCPLPSISGCHPPASLPPAKEVPVPSWLALLWCSLSPLFCEKARLCFQFSQLSHSVMSDSLQPHGIQHTRPPCPSPNTGVYSNSYPLSESVMPSQPSQPLSSPSSLAFSLSQHQRASECHSVLSDSLQPHGLYPWNSPGQNTGVGSHSLLQGIFPTQGSNSGLLQDSLLSEARGISSNREARFTKVAVTVLTQATRNLRKTSIITLQAMGTKRFRVPRTHYDLK